MWAKRNGKNVFYRSTRVNGKPTKVYLGTGIGAETLAAEIECRKQARMATSEACAAWKTQAAAAESPLDDLCASLELLASASLLAQGYHRHDRSTWRKRREHFEVPAQ